MKRRAYLDIETTGLSRYECELTVIGVGLERGCIIQVVQLIEDDMNERRLLGANSPPIFGRTSFFSNCVDAVYSKG
jgi:uncharacterized protein YprB with RNaseH-like and TPR domain